MSIGYVESNYCGCNDEVVTAGPGGSCIIDYQFLQREPVLEVVLTVASVVQRAEIVQSPFE